MNLTERFRGHVVATLLSIPTFYPTWPDRRSVLQSGIPAPAAATAREIVRTGERLSAAFLAGRTASIARTGAESQSGSSRAGYAWHCLVTYYLNLVYAGTDAVAVMRRSAPRSLSQAMRVSYSTTNVEGDLDVAVVVLPGASTRPDPSTPTVTRRRSAAKRDYWELFDREFRSAHVSLIACKTNWNDQIQSAMLWGLLYQIRASTGALPAGLTIGSGGFALDQLSHFATAFVTVPTNQLTTFNATSMAVQRARTMSGGYYWGSPRKAGVAENVTEYLDRQASLSSAFPPPSLGGVAFSEELARGLGNVDVDAFEWTSAPAPFASWPSP